MDIRCMEPIALPHVAQGAFLHQIKWDGIRGVTVLSGEKIAVYSKNGRDMTAAYPELAALGTQVDAVQAVLDGELVVFVAGRPSFYHALKRTRAHGSVATQYPARYVVFDLLALDGRDLRGEPIEKRQALLRSCFVASASAALADSFDDGEALFALMRRENMEGIVSKRRGSIYTPGKTHTDWFKTKIARKLLCTVTGVRVKNGHTASLCLGVYRDGVLTRVGHVSAGLSQEDLRLLDDYARREGQTAGRNEIVLEPRLTCWVRFTEWTPSGTLRHPVLLGFSDSPVQAASGEEVSL